MRYQRTTGLTRIQMEELVRRAESALSEPWDKRTGRPKECSLYETVEIACMYARQNAPQEFIRDMRGVSQATVSRIVKELTPVVRDALDEFVPSEEDAARLVQGRVVLVVGTLTPCWSYAAHPELWNKKHKTTGFNTQLIGFLDGSAAWISDALPGKMHDAAAFASSGAGRVVLKSVGGIGDKGYQGTILLTPKKKPRNGDLTAHDRECNSWLSALRAPIERLIAHFKSWKIFHADYRRPYSTYQESFGAARALFFFSNNWGFE